jgi:hypothetical protein
VVSEKSVDRISSSRWPGISKKISGNRNQRLLTQIPDKFRSKIAISLLESRNF